ncbi:hypothetical protein RRG08_012220 [Elysia crispata]|uniref:Uncharacterized protein n=1 Tax=Elysia crispata TaxID=231223 RepID=A0AAE1DAM5_9GAST|nr:hypothetical protein RRG08_012220 [Elysia crispata]
MGLEDAEKLGEESDSEGAENGITDDAPSGPKPAPPAVPTLSAFVANYVCPEGCESSFPLGPRAEVAPFKTGSSTSMAGLGLTAPPKNSYCTPPVSKIWADHRVRHLEDADVYLLLTVVSICVSVNVTTQISSVSRSLASRGLITLRLVSGATLESLPLRLGRQDCYLPG